MTLQNTFPGGFTGLVRTVYEVAGLLSGFCCSQLGEAGSAKLVQGVSSIARTIHSGLVKHVQPKR